MKNSIFKKLTTMFVIAFVVCIGFTQPAQAGKKLETSYFFGITANFEGNSFTGDVVLDDDGKFDEAYHSFAHATNYLNLHNLRCGDYKNGMPSTVSSFCAYNMSAVQVSGAKDNGEIASTWINPNKETEVPDLNKLNVSYTGSLADTQKKYAKWANGHEGGDFKQLACKTFWGEGTSHSWDGNNMCQARQQNAIYTWPGVTDGGTADAEDEAMLNWVNSTLVSDFNDAISFVLNRATVNTIDSTSSNGKMQFLDIAALIAAKERQACTSGSNRNAGGKSSLTFSINGKFETVISFECASSADKDKLDLSEPGSFVSDFVKIQIGDDVFLTRWAVPKGYKKVANEDQRLAGYIEARGSHGSIAALSRYFTTEHIVYQAMFNYYMDGQTSNSTASFYSDEGDVFSRTIVNMFTGLINSVNGILHLYTMEEIILNGGSRGLRYWMGVIPTTWFNATQYFYLFTFSISMIMLLVSLVRLAFEKGLSTIGNAARRVSLIEGIKKTIFAAIACVLFSSIFIILCQLNYSIVTAISGLVNGEVLFTSVASGGSWGSLFIMLIYFYISLRMNFSYILRGITLLLCYLIGPICIMCSAMGEKYSMITQNWMKELIGNLFIQSIHALIMMVFISVSRYGSQSSIEKIVLVYSFVPLTEFIRTNVFALGKGMDAVAGNLSSSVGGLTLAAGAGAAGAVFKGIGGATGKLAGKISGGGAAKGGAGAAATKLTAGRVGGAIAKTAARTLTTTGKGIQALGMSAAGLASGATNETGSPNGALFWGGMRGMTQAFDDAIPGYNDSYGGGSAGGWDDGKVGQGEGAIGAGGNNTGFTEVENSRGETITNVDNDKLAASRDFSEKPGLMQVTPGRNMDTHNEVHTVSNNLGARWEEHKNLIDKNVIAKDPWEAKYGADLVPTDNGQRIVALHNREGRTYKTGQNSVAMTGSWNPKSMHQDVVSNMERILANQDAQLNNKNIQK